MDDDNKNSVYEKSDGGSEQPSMFSLLLLFLIVRLNICQYRVRVASDIVIFIITTFEFGCFHTCRLAVVWSENIMGL
jgi:hypothetical protein